MGSGLVIGGQAQTLFVDLTHVVLRLGIAGLGLGQPDLEGGAVVRAVISNVFPTADLAVSRAGLDRPPGRSIGKAAAQLADLGRQKTINNQ